MKPRTRNTMLVGMAAILLLAASWSARESSVNQRGTLTVDGHSRTYELHVPASYDGTKLVPLVLVLHGRLGAGDGTAALTHFDSVSDAHGFIAAYPDGLQRSWADGRGATSSGKDGINDIKFIAELIQKLSPEYKIDRTRLLLWVLSPQRSAKTLQPPVTQPGPFPLYSCKGQRIHLCPSTAVPLAVMRPAE